MGVGGTSLSTSDFRPIKLLPNVTPSRTTQDWLDVKPLPVASLGFRFSNNPGLAAVAARGKESATYAVWLVVAEIRE
jgi:hypothetical protein